jgi:extracellular factor (EF) 3-hydroxypalmitic acid methyl ester biosynthesis protein
VRPRADEPTLSPRELAVRFTDTESCFVSEASVYRLLAGRAASQGVRNRRDYIAKVIDEIAERKPKMEVLAVACGHLRELERCSPTSRRAIARFVGLDHDRRTTNYLARQAYSDFVKPLTSSIGVLLRKEIDLGSFDLIYVQAFTTTCRMTSS